jgi:archaemetzincin
MKINWLNHPESSSGQVMTIKKNKYLHMKTIILPILATFFVCCESNFSEKQKLDDSTSTPIIKESIKSDAKIQKPIANIVIVQPFDGISENQVMYIYNELKKVIPKVILNKSIPLPIRAYYKPRNRYRADTLNLYLKERTKNGFVTIGLTNKDISTDNGNIVDWGVMGLAYMPGKSCTVSPFRLSKKNANEQFFKVAIHELGHTQGLDHCLNNTCIMTDANGKNNTDREKGFCARCKPFLEKKGWNLKDL